MRNAAVVLFAVFVPAALGPVSARAQEKAESPTSAIFGYVVDQSTSERITGATVEFPELGRQVITNSNGAFAVVGVPRGRVAVRVRHLGFADYDEELDIPSEAVTVTIALGARPVILEGITAQAYSFGERLRSRRRRAAVSVRAIERDRLSMSGATDALRALLDGTVLRRASCRGTYDAFDICVWARGRSVRPTVYIDERPAFAGLSELEMYRPDELYAIEVYQGGRHVRAYTTWWVETQASGDQSGLMPVIFW